jgi:hypothetical protein
LCLVDCAVFVTVMVTCRPSWTHLQLRAAPRGFDLRRGCCFVRQGATPSLVHFLQEPPCLTGEERASVLRDEPSAGALAKLAAADVKYDQVAKQVFAEGKLHFGEISN